MNRRCVAYVMLGVGVFLLLSIFVNVWMLLWPFAILGLGAIFLNAAVNDNPTPFMAVPGMIITGTGLIFLFQVITGHFESWAYAWSLYPVFLGIALVFAGEREDNQVAKVGRAFIQFGLIGFGILAAFFELFIFQSLGTMGSWMIAIALLMGGYWL